MLAFKSVVHLELLTMLIIKHGGNNESSSLVRKSSLFL